MASSITMPTSFFGGAVATKPATATTSPSQLAVRASMDLQKEVAAAAETTNTRRGLVLAGMAAAAASSVAKAATADTKTGGYTTVPDPSAPEYIILAKFAVSEINGRINESLTLELVLKVETQVVSGGLNYRLTVEVRNESRKSITYEAVVSYQAVPTSLQLTSFKTLLPQ